MGASIVETIVDAAGSFATGLGKCIVDLFNNIVVTEDGGLTNFATWALVFAGLGIITAVICAVLRKVG